VKNFSKAVAIVGGHGVFRQRSAGASFRSK
jgi:hypothetical protein